jgi:hypothetical protein
LPDLDDRERSCLWPLAIAALVMGVAPSLWMNRIDQSVAQMLAPFQKQAAAQTQHRAQPNATKAAQEAQTRHSAAISLEKASQVNGR